MLLSGKTALVYGASGAVGGAVARAFAREGASVILSARRREPLEIVSREIAERGGAARFVFSQFDAAAPTLRTHCSRS